jgi:hypothetical protein
MDRQIVYPASIPLDTDFLLLNRNTLVALGALAQATLGASTIADGLACQPTTPASLAVTVGAGSITQLGSLDSLSYGSLAANTLQQIVKMGINPSATTFALTPPATPGQSVVYLIEASFVESDATAVVLPYVNAANPALPYSGPANSGVAQNTQRLERVQLQLKAGAAASTGAQTAPAIDAGWVGLSLITVNNGQTAVTSSAIVTHPAAPFISFKLPSLTPGFSRRISYPTSASFTVPNGVTTVRATVVGGGGGGGGSDGTYAAAGGGAGGFASGTFTVTPGSSISVTVGAGGAGGAASAAGGAGGTSSFGAFCSATGGAGGLFGNTTATHGGAGGSGSGGEVTGHGGYGSDGQNGSAVIGGQGGASMFGGGGRASAGSSAAMIGQAPGSGAGGSYNIAAGGGQGAAGIVILEY